MNIQRHSVWPPMSPLVILAVMASTSGLAILLHVFGPLRMRYTVPFVVMPSVLILIGLIARRDALKPSMQQLTTRILVGGLAGFVATVVYDVVRPLVRVACGYHFDAFRAIVIFGQLMTGLDESSPWSWVVGWLYHFWNGISFGMMFTLFVPSGGVWQGLVWGLGLESLMLIAYPRLLSVRLADTGFLVISLVGHAAWGVVLGLVVAKRRREE